MVIRATTRLGPGIAETELTAKWVASKNASSVADLRAQETTAECSTSLQNRAGAASVSNLFGGGDFFASIFETGKEMFEDATDTISKWVGGLGS